jgi:hypothetical protein
MIVIYLVTHHCAVSMPSSWPYIVGFLEWLCGLSLTYESFDDATFYRRTDVIDQQQQQQQQLLLSLLLH